MGKKNGMQIVVDSDVQAVLEFMQANLPADKLLGVADGIPEMARLLWKQYPQEPCPVMVLRLPKPLTTGLVNQLLPTATE